MAKCRSICMGVLITAFLLVLFPKIASAEENLLLVCQNEAEGEQLLKLIAAAIRQGIEPVLEWEYEAGMAADYRHVITTSARPVQDARDGGAKILMIGEASIPTDAFTLVRMEDTSVTLRLNGYTGPSRFEEEITLIETEGFGTFGEIGLSMNRTYPFAVLGDPFSCVPYYRPDDLGAIMLGQVIQRFLGISGEGRMYVLIDEVYPFSDLYMLCRMADMLYENAIPYIVRIMPVYNNLDYPAFLRYAQVLRYIQAKNGSIVLHDPLIAEHEMEREPLKVKMARLYEALEREGIHVLEMPYDPYEMSIETVQNIEGEGKAFGSLPFDTMIMLPFSDTEEELSENIAKLNQKWLSLYDYRRNFTEKNYQYKEVSIDSRFSISTKKSAALPKYLRWETAC